MKRLTSSNPKRFMSACTPQCNDGRRETREGVGQQRGQSERHAERRRQREADGRGENHHIDARSEAKIETEQGDEKERKPPAPHRRQFSETSHDMIFAGTARGRKPCVCAHALNSLATALT